MAFSVWGLPSLCFSRCGLILLIKGVSERVDVLVNQVTVNTKVPTSP